MLYFDAYVFMARISAESCFNFANACERKAFISSYLSESQSSENQKHTQNSTRNLPMRK